MLEDLFYDGFALILVALAGFNLFTTYLLFGFAKNVKFKYPAVNERAISSGIGTSGSIILVSLGLNRALDWHWPSGIVLVLLITAIILYSLPPVTWLYFYKTGRFRIPREE